MRSKRRSAPRHVRCRLAPRRSAPRPDTENPPERECWDAALRFLASRPRSLRELRLKLGPRFGEPVTESIIERLAGMGLADDAAFARYWLENRERHRPRGARALRSELGAKGIDRGAVEDAIATAHDEFAAARTAAQARARRILKADARELARRLHEHLQRRGFDWEAAEAAVREVLNERSAGDFGA